MSESYDYGLEDGRADARAGWPMAPGESDEEYVRGYDTGYAEGRAEQSVDGAAWSA